MTATWRLQILVSEPHSSDEIMNLMRQRIASYTATSGMSKPIPHIRGKVRLSPVRANDTEVRWKFTDDQGRGWSGLAVVEPAPDDKGKFIATLKLARDKT